MCDKQLLHQIPVPPISVFLLDDEAIIVHPTLTSLDSSKTELNRIIGTKTKKFVKGVIDERTTVRQILSFIATIVAPDTLFAAKELTSNQILALSFKEKVGDDFAKWIREADQEVIPQYRGWSSFIGKRGPFVFQVVTHKNPRLHSFPNKNKQISENIMKSMQETSMMVYDTLKEVREAAPCTNAEAEHYSFIGTLKQKPNLIYLSNNITLTNNIPCVVYRPTLNELQMKSKLYLPRIHSKWKKEEMKLLMQTTTISSDNKFTSIPRRGLFVWFQVNWEVTGTTKGVVQEILENGDVLLEETKSKAQIVVPSIAVDDTQPLKETEVRIGKPIWALLHIHPKGQVTLTCTKIDEKTIEHLKEKTEKFIELNEEGWQDNHFRVKYQSKGKWNRQMANGVINSISSLKSFLHEKRIIVPSGNQVQWFSKDEQKWKQGTIDGYPDLRSYSIKTSKGSVQVPWTSVRIPKERIQNQIEVIMERVNHRKFTHPLMNHISELREKGYNITDIVKNLEESFSIEQKQALTFITDSLESTQNSTMGILVTMPVYSYESDEVPIEISGRRLSDIKYTFRIIQVLLILATRYQRRPASGAGAGTEESKEDEPEESAEDDMEYMNMLEDDMGDDKNNDDDLFDDDMNFDDEISQIREQLATGKDSDSVISDTGKPKESQLKQIFSTTISIFLQSLYDRDPTLFYWQSRANGQKRYTTICQEDFRHPKILSNETKIEVDTNHPGAYSLWSFAEAAGDMKAVEELKKKEKSCDGQSEIINKGDACMAIYHGSGQDKTWYICPRIYDLLEQKPLRLQDLDFETPFKPKGWKDDEWRIDVSGRDITQFEPTYKGRGLVKNLQQSDYNENSLYMAPMKGKYFYPGFLLSNAHPQLLSLPCCFISPNKRLEELFGIQEVKKGGSSNYVQGWNKTLGWDPPRLGLIPPAIRPLFGLHPTLYKTGSIPIKQEGYPMWLRRGIPYSVNPFISCLANSISDGLTEITLRSNVLSKLDSEFFSQLNNGLLGLYMQDINGRQSPLEMYRNHILFGTNLSWIDFLDAYSMTTIDKQVWIFIDVTNPVKPTLINTSIAQYHEKLLQKLYIYQTRNHPEAKKWKVFFMLKNGLSWTPVYKIKQLTRTYDMFRGIPGDDVQAKYWVEQRVKKVIQKQKVPYKFSQVPRQYPAPNSYITQLFNNSELKELHPVSSLFSNISNNYYVGFYHKDQGFLPFYLQSLPIKLQRQLGETLSWTEMVNKPVKSFQHYVDLFSKLRETSPVVTGVRKDSNEEVTVLFTVYGVEIPIEPTLVDKLEEESIPVIITTDEEWRMITEKKLEGQLKSLYMKPISIQQSLHIFNEMEMNYGSSQPQEKTHINRYIPYYYQQKNDVIVALTLKVIQNGKEQRQITIPIRATRLSDKAETDLRKQVGIKQAQRGTDVGTIGINKEVSLSQLVNDLNEIRIRTNKEVTCAPLYYIYSMDGKQVLGIEDETGTKYMIQEPIKVNAINQITKSFILEPLYLSKYDFMQIKNIKAEINDILNDLFLELTDLPYWRDMFDVLSKYATTSNTWKMNTKSIMEIMERIQGEMHKRRQDIYKQDIKNYLNTWVARVGWRDDLLKSVREKQLQKTISENDFKVKDEELLVEATDISTFASIQSSNTGIVPLPLVEQSTTAIEIVGTKEALPLRRQTALATQEVPQAAPVESQSEALPLRVQSGLRPPSLRQTALATQEVPQEVPVAPVESQSEAPQAAPVAPVVSQSEASQAAPIRSEQHLKDATIIHFIQSSSNTLREPLPDFPMFDSSHIIKTKIHNDNIIRATVIG